MQLGATPTSVTPPPLALRVADPQVAAATRSYAPNHPGIDRATFDQVVGVARQALDGLTPVVLVNRRADSALATLTGGRDSLFPTIHTSTPPGIRGTARRLAREATEHLHMTHGTGDNEGHTVFGATRFVGAADARAGADAILGALSSRGQVGVGAYGPVSLLVHPDRVAGLATFAARDTAKGVTRVTDSSHMPEVVAERITRGVPGAPTVAELVAAPVVDAAHRLRDWLLGDGLSRRDGYIEAQVRGLRPSDLDGVHVAHSYDGPVMAQIDPGPMPDATATRQLAGAAKLLGVTFSESA